MGGDLYLNSGNNYIGAQVPELRINKNYFWLKDGKEYALIDGIFCEVLTRREHTTEAGTFNYMHAKSVNKENYFFIASDGTYYAHSQELKGAIEDLRNKIAADKLKKEPINADSLLTVQHYRAITGACDFGCRQFMDANKIAYTVIDDKAVEVEPMKASVLLPLLKKSNAYGVDRFSTLVTF